MVIIENTVSLKVTFYSKGSRAGAVGLASRGWIVIEVADNQGGGRLAKSDVVVRHLKVSARIREMALLDQRELVRTRVNAWTLELQLVSKFSENEMPFPLTNSISFLSCMPWLLQCDSMLP